MMDIEADKRISIMIVFGLVAVTWAIYGQILFHDFISYDDPTYITENSDVQAGLTAASIGWAFSSGYASNWHPLTWLSLMLDYEVWGGKAGGFLATNLIFHTLNALLLFWIMKKMTGSVIGSVFIAGIFAWHPLHVESVAWVTERKDVLSGFFCLAALLAYVGYGHHGGKRRYLTALVLFAGGLMAKPMLVTGPMLLLLLDYWPLDRGLVTENAKTGKPVERSKANKNHSRKRLGILVLLAEKIPFVILAAISSVITFMVQRKGGAVATADLLGFGVRAGNAFISYVTYIIKTFVPTKLAIFYPHPEIVPGWQAAGCLLLLILISAAVLAGRRRYLTMGWLWYLVTLIPMIGIVQVGIQSHADRYMYIPMIGLSIMVVWGLGELANRGRRLKLTLLVSGCAWLFVVSVLCWFQVGCWKDGFTVFSHALEVTRDNHVAHVNLGNILVQQRKSDLGISHYRQALRIRENYSDAYYNLGLTYSMNDKIDESIDNFYKSLSIRRNCPKTCYHLGKALSKKGELDRAIFYYREALKYNSSPPASIYNDLANALVKQKKYDEAIEHYNRAIQLEPTFARAYYNKGMALSEQNRLSEAIEEFRHVLRFYPRDAEMHCNVGTLLLRHGDVEAAIEEFRTSLRYDPDLSRAQRQLEAALTERQ